MNQEEHQTKVTTELIDQIHNMRFEIDHTISNTVYRCGKCKNIVDENWFCDICKYQHNIYTSTRT